MDLPSGLGELEATSALATQRQADSSRVESWRRDEPMCTDRYAETSSDLVRWAPERTCACLERLLDFQVLGSALSLFLVNLDGLPDPDSTCCFRTKKINQ